MTAGSVQGMAPYPGQAFCLALDFWPECFRRLNVKGGQRPFPEETRSALDIEGKHVTIQGPSPDLTHCGFCTFAGHVVVDQAPATLAPFRCGAPELGSIDG